MLPQSSWDIILGYPWLYAHQPTIDWRAGTWQEGPAVSGGAGSQVRLAAAPQVVHPNYLLSSAALSLAIKRGEVEEVFLVQSKESEDGDVIGAVAEGVSRSVSDSFGVTAEAGGAARGARTLQWLFGLVGCRPRGRPAAHNGRREKRRAKGESHCLLPTVHLSAESTYGQKRVGADRIRTCAGCPNR